LFLWQDDDDVNGGGKSKLKTRLIKTGIHLGVCTLHALAFIPYEVMALHVLSGDSRYETISKCVRALWEEGGILAFYRAALPLYFCYCPMFGTLFNIWTK
jgi:hypothetical protein